MLFRSSMDKEDINNGTMTTDPSLQELPDIDDSGTYWIVKAPEHGFKQANVIGFDSDFNYQYSEHGNIYCGNCQRYQYYEYLNQVSSCIKCHAPFKAGAWFNKHTYQVEVNGILEKNGLNYEDAVSFASKKRSPENSIYISYEAKL